MDYINDFEKLRPYNDEEVKIAMKRIISSPTLFQIMDYLFPEYSKEYIIKLFDGMSTTLEMQKEFGHPTIRRIIAKTSNGLTFDGFENIQPDSFYLFISNHRDIFLDSGLLQVLLYEQGFSTTQVAIGSNLLVSPFITDICKINKMFTVVRDPKIREFYNVSKSLSAYLRYNIENKKDSIWIAQRNGRTKDGDDKTQASLLKMLNVSGKDNFIKNFQSLNIVPVSISYEYEPCDALKIKELSESLNSSYKKKPGEDYNSILTGITSFKGRMHLSIGTPVLSELEDLVSLKNDNERIKKLATIIDKQINNNYKLWPTNYIASDLLNNESQFSDFYSLKEKEAFISHVNKYIQGLNGDKDKLYEMFLRLYYNPIRNHIEVNSMV